MMKRAAEAGVGAFVTVATGPEEWQRCLDLAEGKPPVRVALGIHPHEASCFTPEVGQELRRLSSTDSRVVAIGETGLDFFRDNSPRDKQFEAFHAQLEISTELKKPFILHCRSAEPEMLGVLDELKKKLNAPLHGVWHCFTATKEHAAHAVELGLYFGLGGIITYPKAQDLRDAVATLPVDKMLLETDCPFLPPQGWRGQRNEPAYLSKVVEVLAQICKLSPEDVRCVTTENARKLFGTWNS